MARPSKNPPRDPAPPAAETPRTLAQEKSDFTNEGSPPPGHVAGTTPKPACDDGAPVPPKPTAKPAANATGHGPGRTQPPSPAGPVRRAAKGRPAAWRGNG